MEIGIKYLRLVLLIAISVCAFACGGDNEPSTSSKSSSSNSSSSSSTSSSSSSSSSNSSSGSSVSFPRRNDSLSVYQYCDSSVGINHGTHFEVENSVNGRIDFPDMSWDLFATYTISSDSTEVYYSNPGSQPILMKLWLKGSLKPVEIEFPPTNGFEYFDLGKESELANSAGHNGLSLTAIGNHGAISFRHVFVKSHFECPQSTNFLSSCGSRGGSIGSCPQGILPGMPNTLPQPPEARINKTVSSSNSYGVDFSASNSTDANFDTLEYDWDFGDGNKGEGIEVFHLYGNPGIYYVNLTVTDSSGLSSKVLDAVKITIDDVLNSKPKAVITTNRDRLLRPHLTTTLWADVSYDPDGDPLTYVWHNRFTDEVVRESREYHVDFSSYTDSSDRASRVTLGVSDAQGANDFAEKYISISEYPGHDCEIRYHDNYPNFKIFGTLYNNTASPIRDWQVSWLTNAEVTVEAFNPYSSIFPEGNRVASNGNRFSVSGGGVRRDIPPYSWVTFQLRGESAEFVHNIGFTVQEDMACVEEMPPERN